MTKPIRTVTLYKREGSMDKVYIINLVPAWGATDQFQVTYANGRRGSSMQTGIKTKIPLGLEAATKEFEKVEKSKLKDGYTPAESGQAYTNSPDAGRVSGHRPMLPADLPKGQESQTLAKLVSDSRYGMQEKKDGENRILMITPQAVQGANKNGLLTNIPDSWSEFTAMGEVVLCGEQIGEVYHAFDLISAGGKDMRSSSFEKRFAVLQRLADGSAYKSLRICALATGELDKKALMANIDAAKGEGVVFKDLLASFEEGKNNNSIRVKFWESMTCFVLAQNQQRSVAVGAKDPATGAMVKLGNVTIPANHEIPEAGNHVEVRYLYRFEVGALCQPTYLGKRTDVQAETITIAQITRIKKNGEAFDLDDDTLSEQAREAIEALGLDGQEGEASSDAPAPAMG